MVDRRIRGASVATLGGVLTLVGTFLPWLRSGARDRASYTIFDLVERLGFAPDGVIAWSLRLWPLVPLLLVVVVTTAWSVATGHLRWRVPVILAAVAATWVGGTSVAVLMAPDIALFRVGVGPTVTLAGTVVLAAGVAALRPRESAASAAA